MIGPVVTSLVIPVLLAPSAPRAAVQSSDTELEELLAEERALAERSRRSGEVRRALGTYEELLEDDPADAASRLGRARCRIDLGRYEEARADLERALADARGAPGLAGRSLRAEIEREGIALSLELGHPDQALAALADAGGDLDPQRDPRDAFLAGRALWLSARPDEAAETFRAGANTSLEAPADELLAKARCERRLGWLERASRSLVAAGAAARAASGGRPSPDVLAELADLYVEADGEVENPESQGRSPGPLYREALRQNPRHEAALVGQFRLHRLNWHRQTRAPEEILEDLLQARPDSIEGLLVGASADLDDGRLVSARTRLARLRELAPGRREVRTLAATLAWIEHRRERAEALLSELAQELPYDAAPEREVGRTLNELYRFAEALPFEKRAVERDPSDYRAWTQLGRALANTGQEAQALEAFGHAGEEAGGRKNVWRENMKLVLERLSSYRTEEGEGALTYVWSPDAAAVLGTYWKPFYQAAREDLAARYGFTPGDVRIEVFRSHQDFSVRSTGYEGFPALGVCFGPVVTSVSPLSELRGTFSWARTAYHEFTHVVHLGLSHNRCPRWITEGLATWEEARAHSSWSRNMRRDLVDAVANDDLIPVRELNRAFRGPRILFGYYQGGLLCEMLIGEHGFAPMVRLLEAFDRGLDLDQAFAQVFALSPEEVDRAFGAFCAEKVSELHIEPRWQPRTRERLALQLDKEPPEGDSARAQWAEGWTTLGWSAWQAGRRIDAEQALRRLRQADLETPRSLFLRGEMAFAAERRDEARELWRAGIEAGGRGYRVHMALGKLAQADGDLEGALKEFQAAEADFPGFPEAQFSAELEEAAVLAALGDVDGMMRARERRLAFDSGEYELRVAVARWHLEAGRPADAARLLAEANQVDPFRRALHGLWSEALLGAGRFEEALREARVAALVPPELDAQSALPPSDAERARWLGLEAAALAGLGRGEDARDAARRALELDPDEPRAAEVAGSTGG